MSLTRICAMAGDIAASHKPYVANRADTNLPARFPDGPCPLGGLKGLPVMLLRNASAMPTLGSVNSSESLASLPWQTLQQLPGGKPGRE